MGVQIEQSKIAERYARGSLRLRSTSFKERPAGRDFRSAIPEERPGERDLRMLANFCYFHTKSVVFKLQAPISCALEFVRSELLCIKNLTEVPNALSR